MIISQYMGADEELNPPERDFLKKETGGTNRVGTMYSADLVTLIPPGLKPMKQVELYLKWRKFVPTALQDIVCPRPPEEILQKVKKFQTEKRKEKATQKKPTTKENKGKT